jgi:hypothetical protein
MADAFRSGGKVVTVLRGDARRSSGEPLSPLRVERPEHATTTDPAPGAGTTIYGVPASAVQHCCGRGCKHCRIYWHRLKPTP